MERWGKRLSWSKKDKPNIVREQKIRKKEDLTICGLSKEEGKGRDNEEFKRSIQDQKVGWAIQIRTKGNRRKWKESSTDP
jgi:hypothetical protein